MIHRESRIVAFEPDAALDGLTKLIQSKAERERALEICLEIAGLEKEMDQTTIDMLKSKEVLFKAASQTLNLPPASASKGDGGGRKRALSDTPV